ncbi:MAG: alpha-mannosidase, partial [Acutalibacteraceae bacterium]
ETKRKAARTFANQISNINAFDGYVYGASQPWQFEYIKNTYPEQFKKIQECVKNGTFEPQGGMWVEADTNLSGGEALIRQIFYGKKFFKDNFGKTVKTCWLPDVFGYNGNLPQIIKKSGLDYFMTIKLSWNEHNKFPYRSFRWQGIDSSEVLTHMPPDETYNSCMSPACTHHAYENYPEKNEAKCGLIVFGNGDGGGGPSDVHVELMKRQSTLRNSPKVTAGKAESFFEKLSENKDLLPLYKGELYLEKHQGTYTTQGRNKRCNRLAEYALSDFEALAAFAYTKGYEYPQEKIDEWWKEVLLYQFHDIIPGSSVKRVYDECLTRYRTILSQIKSAKQEVLDYLSSEGDTCFAYNPNSFSKVGVIDGKQIKIEPFGFAEVKNAEKTDSLIATESIITNGLITVRFNTDGEIVSLKDKDGKEFCADVLNRLKLYFDKPLQYNAWDIDWKYYLKDGKTLKAYRHETVKSADKITRINYYKHYKTEIVQRVSVSQGSDVVEIKTRCDFHELFKMLRAEFYPSVYSDTVKCDIQFGSIERSTENKTLKQQAQFEICAHKYVDVSDGKYGFSLMNDCKYGHRVKDGLISLNLLRSPLSPDRTIADKGFHEFTYAIYPHKDKCSVETLKRAYFLNKPILFFKGKNIPTSSIASTDNENVVIETIKKAYGKNAIIIRLFESQGEKAVTCLQTSFSFKNAKEVNLVEEGGRKVDISNLKFKPFEIKTVMLEL